MSKGKIVTHPIKQYEVCVYGETTGAVASLKLRSLKAGIWGLLRRGRVTLNAHWGTHISLPTFSYVGTWLFEVVYVGRKTIKCSGVRHQLRLAHQKFNPYVMPHPNEKSRI